MKHEGPPHFDVFVSYASEDKPYVDPLVKALEDAGVRVWFDKLTLEWGDDLRTTINEGLSNSRYGIVVFSKAFLRKKKWTEYELNTLFAREGTQSKVILPIWHGITREDLFSYSPAFADRLAKISSTDDLTNIVDTLLKMLGRNISVQQNEPGAEEIVKAPSSRASEEQILSKSPSGHESTVDGQIQSIEPPDLQNVLDNHAGKTVFVVFYVSWSAPCRQLLSLISQLSAINSKKVQIYKIEVSDAFLTQNQFEIKLLPTIFIHRNGEIQDRIIGNKSLMELQALINKHSS